MELAVQIFEKAKLLDSASQELLLNVAVKFLGEDDDFLTDEDLKDIETARQERAAGDIYTFADVDKFRV